MKKFPSITKTNHRYRGEAESHKHRIMVQQALHDITDLCHTIDRNEKDPNNIIKGQSDFIQDNMNRLTTWQHLGINDIDKTISNTPTSTVLMDHTQLTLLPTEGAPAMQGNSEVIGTENRLNNLSQQAYLIVKNMICG